MTKDGITLTNIRHPRGKPALGDLNPESLETVEIDLPEPIGYVSKGSAERLRGEEHMTQDEIVEMARQVEFEAGFKWCVNFIELVAFAALVAAKEREAIAKVADGWPDYDVQGLAEAIRARGNT